MTVCAVPECVASEIVALGLCAKHYHRQHRSKTRERYNANARRRRANAPESAKAYAKEYRTKNAARVKAYAKRWREKDPERYASMLRASRLRTTYGLTVQQYDEMLERQGRRCAICKSHTPGGKAGLRFHVDHSHSTGAVRGLLCSKCNTAIGLFNDDTAALESAIKYLREHHGN